MSILLIRLLSKKIRAIIIYYILFQPTIYKYFKINPYTMAEKGGTIEFEIIELIFVNFQNSLWK